MSKWVDSNASSRKIWIGLIIASALLFTGVGIFVLYQIVANYVLVYGPKGELYEKGVELIEDHKYSLALAKAELSIKSKENQAESYLLRANALYGLGRQNEALPDLNLVAKVKPQLAFDLHHKAYRLIEAEGALDDVIRLESLAIAIQPTVPRFYINRAYAYSDLKQSQKAIDDCTFALSLKPKETDVANCLLLNRASAYNLARRYEEALQDSELALNSKIDNDDDHWRILTCKVDALIGLKRFPQALATCDQGIELVGDENPWLLAFNELKIKSLKARNDKGLKDSEQMANLKEECKRLKALVAALEKDEKEKEDKETEEEAKESEE